MFKCFAFFWFRRGIFNSNPAFAFFRYVDESKYLEIKSDGSTTEWTVRGAPGETISIAHFWSTESLDSSPSDPLTDKQEKNKLQSKALTELKNVFDDQLAHQCYAAFYRFLGEAIIENSLKNNNFIRDLYYRYEQEQSLYSPTGKLIFINSGFFLVLFIRNYNKVII